MCSTEFAGLDEGLLRLYGPPDSAPHQLAEAHQFDLQEDRSPLDMFQRGFSADSGPVVLDPRRSGESACARQSSEVPEQRDAVPPRPYSVARSREGDDSDEF